ncbi:g5900 [Coccomyxa viridis]|uniref:G5900 protein n=1 Tax=Coccomyxa viridis TaxID=1274662 RepID=A0ABP1G0Q4_9CHLO
MMTDQSAMDGNLLLSVLGGLGRIEISDDGSEMYIKDDDCVECLKDLQRFLRHDDASTRDAFFVLGKAQTTRTHLIPLITRYAEDVETVYNALKIVTFLTMPVEPGSRDYASQLDVMLDVKDAFLAQDALVVIVSLVAQPLTRHAEGLMTERDTLIVQLVITFLRNLIVIPDSASRSASSGSHRNRMSSKLLRRLMEDSALELLLIMAQHVSHGRLRGEAPLILEIVAALFKGLQPDSLVGQESAHTLRSGHRHSSRQARPAGKPAVPRPLARRAGPRHPRFGGVFTKTLDDGVKQCSLAGAKQDDLLGPVSTVAKAGVSKGQDGEQVHQLDPEDAQQLKAYAERFLKSSYNILMTGLQKELDPGLNISRLDNHSFLRFFKLASFFTGYVRLQQEDKERSGASVSSGSMDAGAEESPFGTVSATLGWETFRLVHSTWLTAVELPPRDENKWDMQHTCLTLLKEMLMTLDLAHQHGSPADRKAADRLQRRLLHDDQKESGLLPVLARLIKQFDRKYQSREHANDLVQCLHVVLRMLKRLGREEAGGFLVQRRTAQRRKSQKHAPVSSPSEKLDAETEPEDLRRSTSADGTGVGEANIPTAGGSPGASSAGSDAADAGKGRTRDNDPLDELQQEEIAELNHRLKEVAVDLDQRIRQELAFPAVVHFYSWLLQGYQTNGQFLNHCLVAFLKRIADPDGINLEPMLWQVSVLRIFHQVLASASFRKQPGSSEVLRFAVKVVRHIFERLVPVTAAETTGKLVQEDEVVSASEGEKPEAALKESLSALLFIEMLFWKNAHDSGEVRDEYRWREMCQKEASKASAAAEAMPSSDTDKDVPSAKSPKQSLSRHTSSSDNEHEVTRSRDSNEELSS